MASITVRHLDDGLKQRLRVRAARNHRSMEEEVRVILREALGLPDPGQRVYAMIREQIAPLGGVELPDSPRDPTREPPLDGVDLLGLWS